MTVMSGRKPGRPQTELASMDAALLSIGGVRHVVTDLDRRGMPLPQQVEWLDKQTGVRVHPDTLRNWLKRWATEGGIR